MQRIPYIDSHTGGEPTRVILGDGLSLGDGTVLERREVFRQKFDTIRSAVVNEPRGSDVLVGAILCRPIDPACVAGMIFFNNVGYLGMCGHGTIGVAVTLAYLGKIGIGQHRIETPVGMVGITLQTPNQVTIENVPSYRLAKDVPVDVPGYGVIRGDIAWGGNWFYLVKDHSESLQWKNVNRLTTFTTQIKQALIQQKITGADGAEIDHVELFGPPSGTQADSKNFVLCPGNAYDRSPCGTGTSAKLACLYADGKLQENQIWRQESILGSVFEGSFRIEGDKIIPRITGTAFVNAEGVLILNPDDPFCYGIRA